METLIGRDRELAIIDGLLDGLKRGTSGVLYIEGEPGIGKTALVSEAIARAGARGYATLTGRGAEFEGDLTFSLFADAIEPHLAVPPEDRHQLLRLARTELEGVGDGRPLLITLDDVHWADPASVDLICHVLHRPLEAPVLLLLAARAGRSQPRLVAALEEAERRRGAARMELQPLSASEAAQLLSEGIDPKVGEQLYEEAGGNPFYLEQLAASVRRGTLSPAMQDRVVPRAVTAAIVDEIGGLSADAQSFAQGAAVAGESFEPEVAAEAAGIPAEVALALLDQLLERDVIRPAQTPRRFRFRHPIVRRAVYESAGAGRTLAAHGRMAAVLARQGASAAAQARHVERSASTGDMTAVALLTRAGEESSSLAPASAARWFEAALRLLPAGDDHAPLRLELSTRRATALGMAGYLEAARDALCELLKLLPPELTPVRRHAVAVATAADDVLGYHDDCERMLLRELANAPGSRSVAGMEIATLLSINRFFLSDWAAMRRWAEEALKAEPPAANTVVAAWSALALGAYGEGDLATANRAVSEAAALFDRTADADIAAHDPGIAVWLGWAETCLERLEDSIRHLERAAAIARSTEQRHLTPGILAFETQALRLMGRLGDIHRNADTVTELALLMDSDVPRRMAMTMRAAAEVIGGDTYSAVRFGERGAANSDRDDPPSGIARIVLAEALLEVGEPDRCDALLLNSDGTPRLPRIPFCEAYGCFQLTRSALARGALEQAESYAAAADRIASHCPTLLPRTSAAQAKGAVLLARGDAGGARGEAEIAIDCAQRLGAPLIAARSRILLGDALAALGDRAAAIEELRSAHSELVSLGAGRHADQAARSLRKLGRGVARRAPPAANGEVSGLTAREMEVLSLVGEGKTNRQIAAELYLSVRTVDRHVSRIFDKLGVSSRAAAASVLARSQPIER
ncbi:MAG: hypothetical protein C5B48_04650 [Candidatus Rokuibacteriota bacterium]|nr:MAG: hypothetical protein C5B48_04650 [Candidatus Rokubacteria bacterium]